METAGKGKPSTLSMTFYAAMSKMCLAAFFESLSLLLHCSPVRCADSKRQRRLVLPRQPGYTIWNWAIKNTWIPLGFAVLQKTNNFNLVRCYQLLQEGGRKPTDPSSKPMALHTVDKVKSCSFALDSMGIKLFCYIPQVDDYAYNWYLKFRDII